MNLETFELETETGTITCEIISQIYSETYKKKYLVYTDNTKDENGDLNIYISSIVQQENDIDLEDIKDPDELENISSLFSSTLEDINDEE